MNYSELVIYTDGGARGNPGPAASGVVITTTSGEVIEAFGKYLGSTTNNQAEWQAVVFALEAAGKYQPRKIRFYMDSELVCRQLNGQYRVKNLELKPHFDRAKALAAKYNITFEHVYRAQNKLADAEVNKAIDQALGLKKAS